jgi:hypothetical protein
MEVDLGILLDQFQGYTLEQRPERLFFRLRDLKIGIKDNRVILCFMDLALGHRR